MIAFDLDGVIYDWHGQIYDYLALNYGVTDLPSVFWREGWKKYNETFWNFLASMEDMYYKYSPQKELVDMMVRINDKYGYMFITQRPEIVSITTRRWLYNFGFPNSDSVVFCTDKTIPCRAYECNIFFEDKVKNAESLSNFTNVILVKQHWNVNGWDRFETIDNILQAEELLCQKM